MTDLPSRLLAALADRYRIERELGAGGMATVYLAADLKHDRKVAIKVLKPELAAVLGAERFVQEIKTTAALSHPHILPLFDSGEAGGFLYYVMPYLQGETIRERLNRETQFGIEEAVKITTEVADALDYAHQNGVIHRDIKPENILLHNGRPMVMDFGIALAVSAAAGGRMTETGLSLGTPHYMSPEQATADKQITARSDIYSLASVLYEMLTGEPPHMGNSAQQIIMKIIADVPRPVTELRKSVPTNITAALGKALEKLPADRFDTAKAFADALGNSSFTTTRTGVAPAHGAMTVRGVNVLWPALVLLVAALGAWGTWRNRSENTTGVVRLSMVPSGDGVIYGRGGRLMTITPDGSTIIYLGRASDSAVSPLMIFTRTLADPVDRPLTGTEGASYPFVSPDGKWVGFLRGDTIQRMPISGGASETIVALTEGTNYAHWGDDGTILYRDGPGIYTMQWTGGPATQVPVPDSILLIRPELLPGSRAIIGTNSRGEERSVVLVDRETGAVTTLVADGTHPHYIRTGYLVFGRNAGGVFAAPFDLRSGTVTGPTLSLIPDVVVFGGGATQFAVADNGTAVFLRGSTEVGVLPVEVSEGRNERVLAEPEWFRNPRYSPSGSSVAVEVDQSSRLYRIFVLDLARGVLSPRTFEEYQGSTIWSRDGKWLTFAQSGANFGIFRVPADGSGAPELLLRDSTAQPSSWSPGDRTLLIWHKGRAGISDWDISTVTFAGDSTVVTPYLNDPWREVTPEFSPDGKWVAYLSGEGGPPNIFVRSFPVPRAKYQVSSRGGAEPRWAPDGKTLYYRDFESGLLVAVELEIGNAVSVLRERDTELLRGYRTGYDVSPTGQGFIALKDLEIAGREMSVVLNWFDLVEQRFREIR